MLLPLILYSGGWGSSGQYPNHVRTAASNVKYWLLPPILKENEATDAIFLEKSDCHPLM